MECEDWIVVHIKVVDIRILGPITCNDESFHSVASRSVRGMHDLWLTRFGPSLARSDGRCAVVLGSWKYMASGR